MADLIPMLAAVAGQAGEEADENFNQTVLLLHGDGTNGAQNNTFLDSSTNNFTITRNGNTTQGTFSPFSLAAGEWSNYFDGTGDYLNVADNAAFATGTNDFTVEAWVFAPSTAANFAQLCGQRDSAGNANNDSPFGIFKNNTGAELNFSYWNGSTNVTATPTITVFDSKWHHVALVRNGTDFRLYVDGVSSASLTLSGGFSFPNSTTIFSIGRAGAFNGQYWTGYISNFRFVNGTAVYTAAFTPPTAPLTAITNTSLLTCQSNRFVDNSTNAFAITRNGDTRVTPFSPFAPSAAYSASTNGGSGYFDGTGDYLTVGSSTDWKFLHDGTTAFTIQAWIYIPDATANPVVIGNSLSSADVGFAFGVANTDNSILYLISKGTFGTYGLNLESSANLKSNAWNHIAVTHDGSSNYTLYINGSSAGTGAAVGHSASNPTHNTTVAVSDSSSGLLRYLTGYIASLKISDVAESISLPTAPFTSDANTKLLLNFTNAGILDNTGKNNLETVGNAQIDTTTKKYGTGSMEFDGTGDYLLAPTNVDFTIITADFTVEFWCNLASYGGNQCFIEFHNSDTNRWNISAVSNINFYSEVGASGSQKISATAPATNVWNHIALVKSGSTFTLYINGSSVGTSTTTSYHTGISKVSIGATKPPSGASFLTGFIDDLRITKGVARYTANFTVPGKAFPDL